MVLGRFFQNRRVLFGILIAGCFVFTVAVGAYIYIRQKDSGQTENENLTGEQEVERLIGQVGQLIELPFGETPTVASVADVEKLAGQPFFEKAKVGDRVLIYMDAKKAYLYRPSENKLIEVSPVVIDPNATASAIRSDEPVSFVVRNGTTRSGLTQMYIPELNEKIPQAIVVLRENASRSDYDTTILSAISADKEQAARSYAEILGIQYRQLPEGETVPEEGEYVIILGADKVDLPELP